MTAEWPTSVLVYGAGDAINGHAGLNADIQRQMAALAQVVTNPWVAGVAQLDSSDSPSIRCVLDPSGQQPVVPIANFDTGDPRVLVDFVRWATTTCPSERHVLVLSGHGCAWQDEQARLALGLPADPTRAVEGDVEPLHHARSLFGDGLTPLDSYTRAVLIDGANRDYLSNAELADACAEIASTIGKPLDVLVFDACLMSSWEVLCEVRGSTATVVASLDELSAAGVDSAGAALAMSRAQGALDARACATAFVSSFSPAAAFDSCVAVDLAGVDFERALQEFGDFCTDLTAWMRGSPMARSVVEQVLTGATSVVEYSAHGVADVSGLLTAFTAAPGIPPGVVQGLRSAVGSVQAAVIGRSVGNDYTDAVGVSIFTPTSTGEYLTNQRDYAALAFARRTGWGGVLDLLFTPATESPDSRAIPAAEADPSSPVTSTLASGDTEFRVDLSGLAIEGSVQLALEQTLRRTVMEELARLDLRGDVAVSSIDRFPETRALAAGRTAGLVAQVSDPSGTGGTQQ